MPFCKDHDHIYFDKLCRTKKAETVLSLIYATDQAKKRCNGDKNKEKEEIAKHLVSAYELFKFDAGTYTGSYDQFQSQYTIGHELGIWKNSDLELTSLAKSVADGKTTIREYFDIVFLNYVQPINGEIVHLLGKILEYMIQNDLTSISKDNISEAFPNIDNRREDINSLYNMLIGTSFFSETSDCLLLNYDAKDIYECCNFELIGVEYSKVKERFDDLDEYLKYLLADHRSEKLLIKRSLAPMNFRNNSNVAISKNNIGYNKIYYGIPGCGKSWHIENVVLARVDKKKDVFRTTFYLDYSNSDFVGQIYPVVNADKSVNYEYVPGPFTKALERALTNPDKMVYLVIEEINRGNAAAIFGDLFQLLDRLKEDRDGRVKGDSEYPISNQFIEGYFAKQIEKGIEVPFEAENIYIPHNLTLLATMNTSDQNVYPLDTAFQRRWDREKVVADLDKSTYADWFVPGTEIKWKDFAKNINIHMVKDCTDKSVTEDKNLGAYFATDAMLCNGAETAEVKKEKATRFANNVMEYLFGTAVKFTPEILFNKEFSGYQDIYDEFMKFSFNSDESESFISLFTEAVGNDLRKNIASSPDETEDGQ